MDLQTWANVARWTARVLSTLYFVFIAWFVAAHAISPEGLPAFWKFNLSERLDTLALLLMVVGGMVGWKWEGVAAVMVLLGTAIWVVVEWNLPWPPGLSLVIGVLYALAWWSAKNLTAPRIVSQT